MQKYEKELGLLSKHEKLAMPHQTYQVIISKLYLDFLELTKDQRKNNYLKNFAISFLESSLHTENLKILNKTKMADSVEDLRKLVWAELFLSLRRETYELTTTPLISEIVYKLLDIKPEDKILDPCSGKGAFFVGLFEIASQKGNNNNKYYGVDINYENVMLSKMVFEIYGFNCEVLLNDTFDVKYPDFDKAYVHPPFYNRYSNIDESKEYRKHDLLTNYSTPEWFFIDKVLNQLPKNGKVASIISPTATFSSRDLEYRNELVKKGLVEMIIKLPSRALSGTAIEATLIIFSNGNKEVKIMDCTKEEYYPGPKYRDTYVQRTLKDLFFDRLEKKDYLILSNEKMLEENNFDASNLSIDLKKIKNGIKLGEIAEIFYGSQYTISRFEKNSSEDFKEKLVLTSSDIGKYGVDWDDVASLGLDDDSFSKYYVQENDLIMTSKSTIFKTLDINFKPKKNIIVSGGMLIIRPNVDKINTTYLKMFFDSIKGKKSVTKIQKGSVIKSIRIDDLKEIYVPCPDLETQNKLVKKYEYRLGAYKSLKKQVEKLEAELDNFFDENGEV